MDAWKVFIKNIAANDSDKYLCDLTKILTEYREVLNRLNPKLKGDFSLSVLCAIVKNLETVPSWRERITWMDGWMQELLVLIIECVRHSRVLSSAKQAKALACIYNLHKHFVTKESLAAPALVLKLSVMPFECDEESLLKEYYKTYGQIILQRIAYIEKLKSTKTPILKLLPRLIEDMTKMIKIYDTAQFCSTMITYLIRKLYTLYNDSPQQLNDAFGKIFHCLSDKDLKSCKNWNEEVVLDIFIKLNECLYTIMENSLKIKLENSVIEPVTRVCICLLAHKSDMIYYFQTVYLNCFCCIFDDKTNSEQINVYMTDLLTSCEKAEGLAHKKTMSATYPFVSQLMKLYIEHKVMKTQSCCLMETLLEICFKLILHLMKQLHSDNAKQLTKCENSCAVKTSCHDAVRLCFVTKQLIMLSKDKCNELRDLLKIYVTIAEQQYNIINKLQCLGCLNYMDYHRKQQTDIHNIAVMLSNHKHYEYSMQLFELYLTNEMKNMDSDANMRNIGRALFNKSICQLELMLYKKSLQSAYLSLAFSLAGGLDSEKYMSLVIDIKSKALNSKSNADEMNKLQPISVLQACDLSYKETACGDLKMFLKNQEMSPLLDQEFHMYVKLWASAVPISGVWKALLDLATNKYSWVKAQDSNTLLWRLYEVVLETITAVRTIHEDGFKIIVLNIVKMFQNTPELSARKKLVYGAMLLIKSEYDIADASAQHGWRVPDLIVDPDKDETLRTIQQEHEAISAAVQAVEVLTDAVHEFKAGALSKSMLCHIVQILCVSVHQLLYLNLSASSLQLAYIGCTLAYYAGDRQSYIRHASALIYRTSSNSQIESIIERAVKYAAEFIKNKQFSDLALCLLCNVAIYCIRSGSTNVAGKLIQTLQKIIILNRENENINLELSKGRLLEALAALCPSKGPSTLSDVSTLVRYYLNMRNPGTGWLTRHATSLYIKSCITCYGRANVRAASRLSLLRRANCAAAPILPRADAATRAAMRADLTNTYHVDALTKINNHLKQVLKPDNIKAEDIVRKVTRNQKGTQSSTPDVEIMLQSMRFQKMQITNEDSLIFSIPAFQYPDFFQHAETCTCYACMSAECIVIACQIAYLEASTYFRAGETEIAHNYFYGVLETFNIAEKKLKNIFRNYKMKKFNDIVIESTKIIIENEFDTIRLQCLIELVNFELYRNELAKSDDHIATIHEILKLKNVDPYLENQVSNLLVELVNLSKSKKHVQETYPEIDMENLKLSPSKLKTPESKNKMPVVVNTTKVVKKEELPDMPKGARFKIDFDAATESENVEMSKKDIEVTLTRSKFKIPVPVTKKQAMESITPRPSRSKPKLLITQPYLTDVECTPKSEPDLEFFTPCQSTSFLTPTLKTYSNNTKVKPIFQALTDNENTPNSVTDLQFSTPMSTLKSYSGKCNLIAKKLESEFLSPLSKVDTKQKAIKSEVSQSETNFKNFEDHHNKKGIRRDAQVKGASMLKHDEGKERRTRSKVETESIKSLSDKKPLKSSVSSDKVLEENKPISRARRAKKID